MKHFKKFFTPSKRFLWAGGTWCNLIPMYLVYLSP